MKSVISRLVEVFVLEAEAIETSCEAKIQVTFGRIIGPGNSFSLPEWRSYPRYQLERRKVGTVSSAQADLRAFEPTLGQLAVRDAGPYRRLGNKVRSAGSVLRVAYKDELHA